MGGFTAGFVPCCIRETAGRFAAHLDPATREMLVAANAPIVNFVLNRAPSGQTKPPGRPSFASDSHLARIRARMARSLQSHSFCVRVHGGTSRAFPLSSQDRHKEIPSLTFTARSRGFSSDRMVYIAERFRVRHPGTGVGTRSGLATRFGRLVGSAQGKAGSGLKSGLVRRGSIHTP